MKAFMAASIIALGLSGPIVTVRAEGARTAFEGIERSTDEQLQRYASAVRQVSALAADYQPRLEAARDEATRQALQAEASRKMAELVEASGLSLAQYNGLSHAMRQDPALFDRIERLVSLAATLTPRPWSGDPSGSFSG